MKQDTPPDPAEFFNAALLAIDGGEPEAARDALMAVVSLAPEDAEAVVLLARVERELGHEDSAIARLQIAVAADPQDVDAHVELADLCLQQGRPGEAARWVKAILEHRPNHFDSLFLLGNAFLDVKAYEEASNAFQAGLEVNPFSSAAWYNMAKARQATGDSVGAASAFRAYLRAAPRADDLEEVQGWIARLEAEPKPV